LQQVEALPNLIQTQATLSSLPFEPHGGEKYLECAQQGNINAVSHWHLATAVESVKRHTAFLTFQRQEEPL
jgi:hypothetical protein